MRSERRIRVRWDDFQDCAQLVVFDYDTYERKPRAVMTQATFEELDQGHPAAPLLLAKDSAQQLFDDLWSMGFRPKNFGSEGVVAAMKEHIEDLRKSHLHLLLRGHK